MSTTLSASPAPTPLRRLAQAVLDCEWLILLLMVAVMWFSDFNRVGILLLWPPLLAARWVVNRRLWRRTPLDAPFAALFALGLISAAAAPFRYGPILLGSEPFTVPIQYTLIALGRPLLGLALVTSFAEMAARRGHMRRLLLVTMGLALLVGLLGLFSAQYTVKSLAMQPIIDLLPRWTTFPGARGGFNVNEIAGAMAWLAPLSAGISFYAWRARAQKTGAAARLLRVLAPLAFALLWAALFLGQSRMALLGVLPALALLVLVLLRGRARAVGVGLVLLFALLQALIYFAPPRAGAEAERLDRHNEISSSSRLEMWSSGLAIVRDHPLTGAGVNMYRAGPVREQYPVPSYASGILPHAHNEWLQAATDLGLPGLLVFLGFQAAALWMLWRVWRDGEAHERALALAIGAGLAAHAVYGLGDAITLWDRFAFLSWWMLGLAAAQYVLVRERGPAESKVLRETTANVA
jgi:O-antigen ligase